MFIVDGSVVVKGVISVFSCLLTSWHHLSKYAFLFFKEHSSIK